MPEVQGTDESAGGRRPDLFQMRLCRKAAAPTDNGRMVEDKMSRWIYSAEADTLKRMFEFALDQMHNLLVIKRYEELEQPKIRAFHQIMTEVANRKREALHEKDQPRMKEFILKLRDVMCSVLDEDRPYLTTFLQVFWKMAVDERLSPYAPMMRAEVIKRKDWKAFW